MVNEAILHSLRATKESKDISYQDREEKVPGSA